ncbi:hypothetical protein A1O3_05967 [Capronia epimyces CBS 606.96]|uniref:MARVEL domain-containing protein n=1 Tax=Capronia epimyces CBS 606.96 TaxID=1182542 RepID=W9XXL5_9EURO|nr:uncharacterized protein A1O3_05967 [Capronia epimyces CBS 606.96]EXJ85292.1 hypothetical protein A1O3_05967 [Capronia epimyces CBS 606.96]
MPVIWGLDLREIQWGKFKSSYMWGNKDYHLRRTKFVLYQIAMTCCVVSESVGTAALTDYVKQQSRIEKLHSSASVHNDDFVGIASYNIFVGIAVATVFGAAFFFDLIYPERYEPPNIRWAWRISAVVVTLMTLADALALTVIVATGNAWISADTEDALLIAQERINPPLIYRHNARALASVVFLWIGLCGTIASCIILWLYYQHLDTYGPKSHSARTRDEVSKSMLHAQRATSDLSARDQELYNKTISV